MFDKLRYENVPVYAGYDTETTGLPVKKATRFDKRQPHIMQLACLITDIDGKELNSMNRIIKPQGYLTVDPGAENAHGISFERAMDEGLPRKDVLEEFLALLGPCHIMVAHNNWFDLQILDFAFLREYQKTSTLIKSKQQFCSMKAWTPIVKLPPTEKMRKYGFGPYKNASLTEVHTHLFGEGFDKAHDAMNDVRAMMKSFFHLPDRPMPLESNGLTR